MNETRVMPPDVSIGMARDDLEGIPELALPPGYRFRGYQPGDDVAWTAIQRVADTLNAIDEGLFGRQYGIAPDALPDRMFFVVADGGGAVGTISAWWEQTTRRCPPGDRGRIHWVAVRPEHQRRGIGKAMMAEALKVMAGRHERAMLDTSAARPWAVKLYLDFGFVPEAADLADPSRREAWRAVQRVIRHPVLGRCLDGAG